MGSRRSSRPPAPGWNRSGASAADLKFLHRLRHARLGTSNRKAALEIICLLVPLCFRSSCQRMPPRITNFGSGALAAEGARVGGSDLGRVEAPPARAQVLVRPNQIRRPRGGIEPPREDTGLVAEVLANDRE